VTVLNLKGQKRKEGKMSATDTEEDWLADVLMDALNDHKLHPERQMTSDRRWLITVRLPSGTEIKIGLGV
jgi:hypothetical protein